MSIWGKLAAAELLIGGPIAALLARAAPTIGAKNKIGLKKTTWPSPWA